MVSHAYELRLSPSQPISATTNVSTVQLTPQGYKVSGEGVNVDFVDFNRPERSADIGAAIA